MSEIRITTWNVNGIRAVLKKGAFSWIQAYAPDIICLQEVKARADQLPDEERELPGYTCYWNAAARPGYSGVVIYTRSLPQEFQFGLGIERFDLEGRVIRLRFPGFYLYNVYFPNGQRGLDRVAYKLDFYAALLQECEELHAAGEKVIITGDFNTAHNPIDLANPRQNQMTSGFLPQEREWIDRYLARGFVDVFRQLYPDRVQYTWWTFISAARTRNIGWRLDYFLASRDLLPRVQDVVVHQEVMGSDHCPVTLVLQP